MTVFTGVDDPVELAYAWEDLLRTADLNGDGDISKDELLLYCLGDEPLTAEGDFEDEELAAHLSVELKKLRAAGPPVAGTSPRIAKIPPPRLAGSTPPIRAAAVLEMCAVLQRQLHPLLREAMKASRRASPPCLLQGDSLYTTMV